ncbi:hypothetical protein [Pseudomonas sp. URIL14HWK12:I7]|uniref:hypothetical protein n=1 Tax=Pseudomonas TaxID=286 RepID=UPI0004863733|nr:hypothetical protein [Pseudomonas sp. URIL14HWK12:I7]
MEWVAVVQQLNRDLFAIEMVKSGLAHQQSAIRSIPLVDPTTGTPVSKDEFKDLASAQGIIEQVGLEALIGLVSNAIETFSIRLDRHLNQKWEPFTKARDDIRFADRARQFRAVNNIFKHQEGYVEQASSRSARFLVENGYFEDETYLKNLPVERIIPSFEQALFETFAHLYDLSFKIAGLPGRFDGVQGEDLILKMKEVAVYQIVEPTLFGKRHE